MGTIDFYNKNAKEYFDKTVHANMILQYDFFLKHIKKNGKVLDFGCGSGRDSLYFKNLGYDVVAIDGSDELCNLAKKLTGLDVKCMDFKELKEENEYDGIWACSSLVHVPKKELIGILKKMSKAIKEDGYIYISIKNGKLEEVKEDGRFFTNLTKEEFEKISKKSDLELIDYFNSESVINSHDDVVWGNYLLKRK